MQYSTVLLGINPKDEFFLLLAKNLLSQIAKHFIRSPFVYSTLYCIAVQCRPIQSGVLQCIAVHFIAVNDGSSSGNTTFPLSFHQGIM